ncbi:MAG: carotenoid biosynthesis protein [Bacteroidota bacterium]
MLGTLKLQQRLRSLADRWQMTRAELLFSVFLVFSFVSGIQAHVMPSVYPLTQSITDALLLVVCAPLLWLSYARGRDQRLWIWAVITYACTFFIEVAGVATGAIFGAYAYGPTMWIQWLEVPLIIAVNWTLLIMAMSQLATRFTQSPWLLALLTGVFIMIYDYFIEPVAIRLDYWTWAAVDIPLQNYLAWGVIAMVLSYPLHRLQIRYQNPALLVYAAAQLVFFVGLQILL